MAETSRANVLLVDDQPAKLLTYRAISPRHRGEPRHREFRARGPRCPVAQGIRRGASWTSACRSSTASSWPEMIRDHPRFSRTAIIFVSGIALTELDRLRGYECGAVDYLPVPIVPEILRAKVTAFVELHRKTSRARAVESRPRRPGGRTHRRTGGSRPPEGRVSCRPRARTAQPARRHPRSRRASSAGRTWR